MKPFAWRLWGDIWKLSAIRRIAMIALVIISAVLLKALTEEFHIRNNSWTGLFLALAYLSGLFLSLRLLKRKASH